MKQASKNRPTRKLQRAAIEPYRFALFNLLSFNAYTLYWGWQMWEVVRRKQNTTYRFKSSLRSFFLGFTGFKLFPYIQEYEGQYKGYKKWLIPASNLAAIYLGFLVLSSAVGRHVATPTSNVVFYAVSGILEIIILLPVVTAAGRLARSDPKLMPPARINWVLMVISIVLWIILFLGFLSSVLPVESYEG